MQDSLLCSFMKNHLGWRTILPERYGICIKEEWPLVIFNYDIGCDFSDPIVQEARGIIIDEMLERVVCWPFRKFGNYNEYYADKIDWNTARVQEKIDGSIIKMWWNIYKESWQFSTNSVIDAYNAMANAEYNISFGELIERASNYHDLRRAIKDNALNKDFTYIFELTSPYNQVVIKYDDTRLTHIGMRNNITGEELKPSGEYISTPKEYSLRSLDDCIKAAEQLNKDDPYCTSAVSNEGFVVVDKKWNRIKIKSPDYLMLHHLTNNSSFSKDRILDMIRNSKINIQSVANDFPEFTHYFKYYDFKVAELEHQAKVFCDLTDVLYEEYSNDRKATACAIKNHRLSSIAFRHLDTGKSAKEILDEMPLNRYSKLIPDYAPERLRDWFRRSADEKTD